MSRERTVGTPFRSSTSDGGAPSVSRFLMATVRPDLTGTASLRELYRSYSTWCSQQGIAPIPAGQLGQELRSIFDAIGLT